MAERLPDDLPDAAQLVTLTEREREVLSRLRTACRTSRSPTASTCRRSP
jgi:hypothetical protein